MINLPWGIASDDEPRDGTGVPVFGHTPVEEYEEKIQAVPHFLGVSQHISASMAMIYPYICVLADNDAHGH